MVRLSRLFAIPVLATQLLAVPNASANGGFGELLGTAIGAVAGGALCHELSNGRQGATALCAAAGALIGSKIARDLSRRDQESMVYSYERIYTAPVGQPIDWQGDRHRGRYEVIRTGYWARQESSQCRQFSSTIYDSYGRVREQTVRTTCQVRNEWVYVNNSELVEVRTQRPPRGGDRYRPTPQPIPQPPIYSPTAQSRAMSESMFDTYYLSRLAGYVSDEYRMDIVRNLSQYLSQQGLVLTGEQLRSTLATFFHDRYRMDALRILQPRTVYFDHEIRLIAETFYYEQYEIARYLQRNSRRY